ncbi:MAG: hypothetical protein ACKOZT_12755 [Cyanobium sp.]
MPALVHQGVELVAALADHDAAGAAHVEAKQIRLHHAALVGADHLEAVVAEGVDQGIEAVGIETGRSGGCHGRGEGGTQAPAHQGSRGEQPGN